MKNIISDAEIVVAFACTNFGTSNHRKYLGEHLLKIALSYPCSKEIISIMKEMGLIGRGNKLTEKGRSCCFAYYAGIA